MIKTTFDSSYDLKAAIPKGAKVGIVGCSSCASVYRTGDSERIQEVRESLADHCDVILSTSVDSPCDQRVLRYLAKSLPRFDDVEVFVVLACEAGARSLGGLVSAEVVSPLKTEAFSIRSLDGKSKQACLFCDECSFPDRSCHCPIASCPIQKTDGPCQNRNSDMCVVANDSRCVWLDVPVSIPISIKPPVLPETPVSFPAFLISSPDSLDHVDKLITFLERWQVSTLFIAPSEKLSPLVVIGALKGKVKDLSFGLCLNGSDKNIRALTTDLHTAKALGVEYIFINEPKHPSTDRMSCGSSIELIELIKALGDSFSILVENAFLHESDFFLLQTQLEAGASIVVSSCSKGFMEDRAAGYKGITIPSYILAKGENPELEKPEGELRNRIIDMTSLVGEALFKIG